MSKQHRIAEKGQPARPAGRISRDAGGEGAAWPPSRKARWLAIYVPLLLGTMLRLAVVHDVRFTGEEALFYSQACKIANFVELPWHGPKMSGSGYHPGPLFFVICSVPLLLNRDPVGIHVWLIVLNALGILLLGRMTLRLLGSRAAFIVVALLSSSPWHFVYSIGVWQPHIMLPLFAVVLWSLERMRQKARSRSVALVLPLLLVLFQIHPSCLLLWLIAVAFAVVYRIRINATFAALGLALALLLYAPYLAHELTNNFENTRRVAGDVQDYPWSLTNPARSVWYHFMMTSGNINFHLKHGYWRPVPETLAQDVVSYWRTWDPVLDKLGGAAVVYKASNVVTQILAAVVAAAWTTLLVGAVTRRNLSARDTLTLAFLLAPLAVFAVVFVGRKEVYPNYILFAFPATFVGYALLDRWIAGVTRSRFNLIVVALVGILFVPRIAVGVAYTHQMDSARGLGTQKAFARWVADRGRFANVRNFGWYNRGMKEPITRTLARWAMPELLDGQTANDDHLTLVPDVLSTDKTRADYVSRRVKEAVSIVDFQVNRNSTFLQWRK